MKRSSHRRARGVRLHEQDLLEPGRHPHREVRHRPLRVTEEARKNYHHELRFDSSRGAAARAQRFLTGMIPRAPTLCSRRSHRGGRSHSGQRRGELPQPLSLRKRCYELLALQAPVGGRPPSDRGVDEDRRRDRYRRLVVDIQGARRLYGMHIDPRLTAILTNMGRQAHQLFRFATDAFADADAPLAAALDDIDDNLDRLQVDLIQAILKATLTAASTCRSQCSLRLSVAFTSASVTMPSTSANGCATW